MADQNAIIMGDVDEEAGNIIVYANNAANTALLLDSDAMVDVGADVLLTLGDPAIDDLSVGPDVAVRIYGHDGTALELGTALVEGGDVLVHGNPGAMAFQVDADALEVGIGQVPVANQKVTILSEATDTLIMDIDGRTAPYSGTGANIGIQCYVDRAAGTETTNFSTYVMDFILRNYKDQGGMITSSTMAGIRALVYDYGDILTNVPAILAMKTVSGLTFQGFWASPTDSRAGNTTVTVEGANIQSAVNQLTVNKAAGTLTLTVRGIYARGETAVATLLTAGTLNSEYYGGHFVAVGDPAGTSIAYGIYADASVADTNWAGYFNQGNVYIQNILVLNGGFDCDGFDVAPVGGGAHLASIPVTVAGGATGYIYVYDSP